MEKTNSKSGVLTGLRTVTEALRLEDFPMDVEAINYAVGDIEVENGHGGSVPVRQLTDHFIETEYQSAEDVIKQIHTLLHKRHAA